MSQMWRRETESMGHFRTAALFQRAVIRQWLNNTFTERKALVINSKKHAECESR
jgi:hypothetical protein